MEQAPTPAPALNAFAARYNESLDFSVLNIPIPGHNLTNTFEHVPAVPPPPPAPVNITTSPPLFQQYNPFASSFPTNPFPPQAANVYPPQTFQTYQPYPINQYGAVAQPPASQQPAAKTTTAAAAPQVPQTQQQVVQQPYQTYSGVQLPATLFSPYQQTDQQAFSDPFQGEFSAPYQFSSSPYQGTQYVAPVQQYQALDYGAGGQAVLAPYGSSSNASPTVVNTGKTAQNAAEPIIDRRLLSYSIGVAPGSS